MRLRILTLTLAVALFGLFAVTPFEAAAAPTTTSGITAPVTGTANFVGTLNVTRFANQGGQLVAIGTLTGTLTNPVTGLTQAVSQAVTLPVTGATGSCQILDLTIGAINLNLLGLVVTTNPIHLNITAQSGPGNLLGNLLCAVANLLNGGGPLGNIAGLLNNILRNL